MSLNNVDLSSSPCWTVCVDKNSLPRVPQPCGDGVQQPGAVSFSGPVCRVQHLQSVGPDVRPASVRSVSLSSLHHLCFHSLIQLPPAMPLYHKCSAFDTLTFFHSLFILTFCPLIILLCLFLLLFYLFIVAPPLRPCHRPCLAVGAMWPGIKNEPGLLHEMPPAGQTGFLSFSSAYTSTQQGQTHYSYPSQGKPAAALPLSFCPAALCLPLGRSRL